MGWQVGNPQGRAWDAYWAGIKGREFYMVRRALYIGLAVGLSLTFVVSLVLYGERNRRD